MYKKNLEKISNSFIDKNSKRMIYQNNTLESSSTVQKVREPMEPPQRPRRRCAGKGSMSHDWDKVHIFNK